MDATRAFIDQCLVPAEATVVPNRSELFNAFKLFCKAKGFQGQCNETTFTNRLRSALPHLLRPRMGVPGKAKAAKVPAMLFGFKLIDGLWDSNSYRGFASGESHKTERGPNGADWGALLKEKLSEDGFACLRGHVLEIPTHEQLKAAKVPGII